MNTIARAKKKINKTGNESVGSIKNNNCDTVSLKQKKKHNLIATKRDIRTIKTHHLI